MTTRSLPLALAAAGALLAGASCALADPPMHTKEVGLTIEHVERAPIHVETDNGAIEIVRADVEAVEVTASVASDDLERLDRATVHAVRGADDMLRIYCEWPGTRKSRESCAFCVRLPDAHGVRAETSNGAITVGSLAGPVDAGTSNGAITIEGAHERVRAATSNGSIKIAGATGPVRAETSNGSVRVSLADGCPGPVHADTSNGSIDLEVGPSFAGRLTADTSLGRVTVGPFPEAYAVRIHTRTKDFAEVEFGEGGEASSLDTSLGSIEVRGRAGS